MKNLSTEEQQNQIILIQIFNLNKIIRELQKKALQVTKILQKTITKPYLLQSDVQAAQSLMDRYNERENWKRNFASLKNPKMFRKEIKNVVNCLFIFSVHFRFSFKFTNLENLSLQFKNAFFQRI